MTFKEFYISDSNGKSNCVVRSLCKILNKEYNDVYNDLFEIAEELNCSFNDILVFERYMEYNGIFKVDFDEDDIMVKDLKIDDGLYIVFCYDRKNFYHMIPIIDSVIYDKKSDCMNLYVISIYKGIIN